MASSIKYIRNTVVTKIILGQVPVEITSFYQSSDFDIKFFQTPQYLIIMSTA